MPQSPHRRPRRVAWPDPPAWPGRTMTAAASAVLLAGGMAGALVATAAPAQAAPAVASASALSANWYESAPYYSTLDSSAPDLGQVMSATGQKAFDMAFILADGGCCAPSWDGTDPVSSDTQVAGVINEVRSDGGDVIVSAGGYNGTKLGQVCGSAAATAAAYQQVITHLRAARVRLRPGGAGDRELRGDRQRAGRGADPPAGRPGPVHLDHDAVHDDRARTTSASSCWMRPRAWASRPNDYTIMPFDGGFSGGVVTGHRAAGLQRAADEHVRLDQRAGLRARGLLRHERPDGLRRVLLPERLPDGAELRARATA